MMTKPIRQILLKPALSASLLAAAMFLSLFSSAQAAEGVTLRECPDKPNCVSSMIATDDKHYIEPIRYSGSKMEAMNTLMNLLVETERTRVVEAKGPYLYATYESKLFNFVDDVEFVFDHSEPVIHVRSASRVGYWDFGANRKRVEAIRDYIVANMP